MNVYLKTIAGDVFAVGMTDLEAIAAAEADGIRVCPPGLLADGGLGEDTTIDQLKGYVAAFSVYPVEVQRMIFADPDRDGAALWQHRSETGEPTSEHLDDSTITVNFTLGGDFAGSDLSFACGGGDQGGQLVVPQRSGLAVVHRGDLAHEVEPITAGERFNLVFWLRERREDALDPASLAITVRNERAGCGVGGCVLA